MINQLNIRLKDETEKAKNQLEASAQGFAVKLKEMKEKSEKHFLDAMNDAQRSHESEKNKLEAESA